MNKKVFIFKMITELEIGKLKQLTEKVDVRYIFISRTVFLFLFDSLEDFLQPEDIEVIKQNSSRYINLTNRVIAPLHRRKVI